MDNRRIFEFLSRQLEQGQGCVLVTVVAVEGSSMRNPGAHMAVSADGAFRGSLSGGCIENAVVAEAQAVLAEGRSRITRFGTGSPYMDIRLPCGGGLDVHFQPLSGPERATVLACGDAIHQRQPFSLRLPMVDGPVAFLPEWRATARDPADGTICVGHWPVPKLAIVGHGAAVSALCRLGRTMEMDIDVLSSDRRVLDELKENKIAGRLLRTPQDTQGIAGDPWTAFIFLFHDHDWEGPLLAAALHEPHFYCGAMGGRTAHQNRLEILATLKVAESKRQSIRAPIGLFHSSRDPESLALSTLAEVVAAYHETDFRAETAGRSAAQSD